MTTSSFDLKEAAEALLLVHTIGYRKRSSNGESEPPEERDESSATSGNEQMEVDLDAAADTKPEKEKIKHTALGKCKSSILQMWLKSNSHCCTFKGCTTQILRERLHCAKHDENYYCLVKGCTNQIHTGRVLCIEHTNQLPCWDLNSPSPGVAAIQAVPIIQTNERSRKRSKIEESSGSNDDKKTYDMVEDEAMTNDEITNKVSADESSATSVTHGRVEVHAVEYHQLSQAPSSNPQLHQTMSTQAYAIDTIMMLGTEDEHQAAHFPQPNDLQDDSTTQHPTLMI